MKTLRMLGLILAILLVQSQASAVTMEVTIKTTRVADFIEFKAESNQVGERVTQHITGLGTMTYKWDMGNSAQDIWYWWDTLHGDAELTVKIDGVTVFSGFCSNDGGREKRVKDTCKKPATYRTTGSPRIEEGRDDQTMVRF